MLHNAEEEANLWFAANAKGREMEGHSDEMSKRKRWISPETGVFKFNMHANWRYAQLQSGMAWIAQDYRERKGTSSYRHYCSIRTSRHHLILHPPLTLSSKTWKRSSAENPRRQKALAVDSLSPRAVSLFAAPLSLLAVSNREWWWWPCGVVADLDLSFPLVSDLI
ncbi:hypothetical protein F2Q69_00030182 [Brassica cretica]|uniref:Uncharacterized protein n=1 Tax=Brassica cretica TaxID=69181 RepID=A0A8S9S035_BRACR|nr:hypothetical protein F2Q69_00030182 [Brassica cretica]